MDKNTLKKVTNIKDVFGAFLLEGAQFAGKYDMPVVKSNIDDIPHYLSSYKYNCRSNLVIYPKTALHFYNFDYVFDGEHGVWNSFVRGIEFKKGFNLSKLNGYEYVISPDYSLYLDMPVSMQIWNIYRSRVITYALQQLGYKVIVNVRWTDNKSYEFCFDGIVEGSIVAVGSYGCSKKREDCYLFENGLKELIKRIKPKTIIIYGSLTDSVKEILEDYNQEYCSFESDISKVMHKNQIQNRGEANA